LAIEQPQEFLVQPVDASWLQCNIECQEACPVGTNCRGYLNLAAEGRFEEGYILSRDPNPVAAMCSYVCSAPCERACRRGDIDRPLAIRAMKRFLVEWHEASGIPDVMPPITPRAERVAVVGAGAMGGAWAGRLAAAGVDVVVIDVSGETVEAIRSGGLTVATAAESEVRASVAATTDARDLGPRDVVFIFVKGPHTRSAAERLGAIVGSGSVVVSLQNGWGNADVIAEHVAAERIVVGVTYEGATIVEPGRINNPGHGPTFLGPYLEGASLTGSETVAELMRQGGFECHVSEQVRTDIWRKLIHNASCLAVAALTDLRTSELVEPGDVADLLDALAAEAVSVAQAAGYPIELAERLDRIHAVLGSSGMGIASMLADAHAHRRTEIDTINGAVVRAAAEFDVPVPLNEAMVSLIHGLERAWQRAE